MKRIIYTIPDGTVMVVIPALQKDTAMVIPEVCEMSEDQYMDFVMAGSNIPADASNIQIIDESELPQDKDNRDAWVLNGNKVEVDKDKAQVIASSKLKKEQDKQAVLNKISLTESELKILLGES